MTSLLEEDESRWGPRALWVALAAPPAMLAVGAIVGLGVLRAVPTPLALVGGIALGVLPILGLRSLLGVTPARLVVASWGWSRWRRRTAPISPRGLVKVKIVPA